MAIFDEIFDCSRLNNDLQGADCDRVPVPGTESTHIIINYVDIDRQATKVTNNVINPLVLKDGQRAFEFLTLPDAVIGTAEPNISTYWTTWTHSGQLRIFIKNEKAKTFVNDLTNARVVIIMKNREEGDAGEVKYEAYGYNAGLKLSAATVSTEMADYVAYDVTMSTPDGAGEATLPKSVWYGSLGATETALNALVGSGS